MNAIHNMNNINSMKNNSAAIKQQMTNAVNNSMSNETSQNPNSIAIESGTAAYKWQMEHENKITDEATAN